MENLADLLRNSDPNNGFDPYSGQVQLQKLSDLNNPFSDITTVNYTIPKDSIKKFIPDIDSETNTGLGSGQYILNDGSTMRVDSSGIVQSATPGRNDYTLNKEGYYQPTGENLTWRGDQNMLTKKIGGVDVNVPGIYHKGGYQNPNGSLRVDENGVPIALAPNYLDSGFGESGLSDAAPYITALTLAAFGMPVGAMAFEGMVPASETLLGSYGAGAAGAGAAEGAGALTSAEMMGGAGGAFTPTAGSGASFALPAGSYTAAGAAGGAMGPTYAEMGYTGLGEGMAGPTYGEMGYTGLNQSEAIAQADAASKAAGGLTGMQKAQLLRMGANSLRQMTGGTGGGGYSNFGGSTNGMQAYQRQNPYLSTAQQNTVPDATTEALTKLLRGYNG